MPIGGDSEQSVIIRRVAVTRGEVTVQFECSPAFSYAAEAHEHSTIPGGVQFCTESSGVLLIQSDATLSLKDGRAVSETELTAEQHVTFVITYAQDAPENLSWQPASAETLLSSTIQYWRAWVAECAYHGRWRETVIRSALVLKLLTYEPTGAIVAAPTFGLPEEIGGVRNWDYRYTWLRDAAMTLNAFLWLGYQNEALQFMLWLKNIASSEDFAGELQIMYGIDGQKELQEEQLTSLKGYRGSQPVRIGNAAHSQIQLDVYGGIGSAALFEVNAGMMIEYDRWHKIRSVLAALSKSWTRPDQGLWEVRGEPGTSCIRGSCVGSLSIAQ
jgi:GH15 family glucan-1,4-alpha-glucosidase